MSRKWSENEPKGKVKINEQVSYYWTNDRPPKGWANR